MLFFVRLTDRPDRLPVRTAHMAAHLAFLDRHRAMIRMAGPLKATPEQPPVGGLWIVEAASASEVEDMVKTDPFWIEGLRERYEILHWSKGFGDGLT